MDDQANSRYEEYWYFSKDGQSTDQSAGTLADSSEVTSYGVKLREAFGSCEYLRRGHYYRVQSDASSPPADGVYAAMV